MLKKILWWIILCIGIINITNAWYVFKFNNTYSWPFDVNYDINVFWKWIPLTNSLWYSKKMLYITNWRYMFWNENQLPYIYSNGIYWQINFYKVCPNLWWEWNPFWTTACNSYPCNVNYWQNNCSQTNITNAEETKNIIWNFFNTLNQSTDYYYIHYVNNLTMFCFYSSNLNKILCFFQPSSSNWTNYWASFEWINSNLLYNPPSYSPTWWWENEWWNNTWWNATTNNNTYLCPTIQQLIDTYPSQYNTGLCYSSNLIYSWWSIQQVEPKTTMELWSTYKEYTDDINLYYNYCTPPATNETCLNAFQWKTEQRSLISKLPSNVDKMNTYEYCHLQLDYPDKNASTCVASGIVAPWIKDTMTTEDFINAIVNGNYNMIIAGTGSQTGSWNIYNEIYGTGDRSIFDIDWNILNNFDDLYTKITGIFNNREWNDGIIPEYITRIFLIIILFSLFKI